MMETLIFISLGLTFYWLMVETKWLTARLAIGRDIDNDSLNKVLNLAPILMIASLILMLVSESERKKKLGYFDKEHKEELRKLLEIHGRKQPRST